MATSRLSLRTLGLATLALVLACAHAVQAVDGQRSKGRSGAYARTSAKAKPARVHRVKNGGRGSNVATFTANGGQRASGVVTFVGSAPPRARPSSSGLASVHRSRAHRTPSRPDASRAARSHAATAPRSSVPVRVIVSATPPTAKPVPPPSDAWASAARHAMRHQPVVLAALATPIATPVRVRDPFSSRPPSMRPVAPAARPGVGGTSPTSPGRAG